MRNKALDHWSELNFKTCAICGERKRCDKWTSHLVDDLSRCALGGFVTPANPAVVAAIDLSDGALLNLLARVDAGERFEHPHPLFNFMRTRGGVYSRNGCREYRLYRAAVHYGETFNACETCEHLCFEKSYLPTRGTDARARHLAADLFYAKEAGFTDAQLALVAAHYDDMEMDYPAGRLDPTRPPVFDSILQSRLDFGTLERLHAVSWLAPLNVAEKVAMSFVVVCGVIYQTRDVTRDLAKRKFVGHTIAFPMATSKAAVGAFPRRDIAESIHLRWVRRSKDDISSLRQIMYDELRADIVARSDVLERCARVLHAVHAFAPVFSDKLDDIIKNIRPQAEYDQIAYDIVDRTVIEDPPAEGEEGGGAGGEGGPTEDYLGGEMPNEAAAADGAAAGGVAGAAAADGAAPAAAAAGGDAPPPDAAPARTFEQLCEEARRRNVPQPMFRGARQTSFLLASEGNIADGLAGLCKELRMSEHDVRAYRERARARAAAAGPRRPDPRRQSTATTAQRRARR